MAEAFLAVGAMCGTPFADQLTVLLRAAEGMATVSVLVCMVYDAVFCAWFIALFLVFIIFYLCM